MRCCPVCGSDRWSVPFSDSIQFAECSSCGLVFDKEAGLLEKDFNRAYEHSGESSSVRNLLDQEKNRKRYYESLADRISSCCGSTGSLLEIGCGTGGLLCELEKRGWRTEGIEPSPRLCEEARSRVSGETPIHPCRLNQASDRLRFLPYGVILAVDVLEHIPDPYLLPKTSVGWLKPEGILFLQTPNVRSLRRWIQGSAWEQLAPGEHFVLHSRTSLHRVLSDSGFQRIDIRTVSGTGVDRRVRRILSKGWGALLGLTDLGNAFWATARKE